jgi:hypothetical protein
MEEWDKGALQGESGGSPENLLWKFLRRLKAATVCLSAKGILAGKL